MPYVSDTGKTADAGKEAGVVPNVETTRVESRHYEDRQYPRD